jgi:hypothetical protein
MTWQFKKCRFCQKITKHQVVLRFLKESEIERFYNKTLKCPKCKLETRVGIVAKTKGEQ